MSGPALGVEPLHHLVTDAGDLLFLAAGTHVGDEDDQASRGHAAQMVVTLDQGGVGSVSRRRDSRRDPGRASSDDENLGFPAHLQLPGGLCDDPVS